MGCGQLRLVYIFIFPNNSLLCGEFIEHGFVCTSGLVWQSESVDIGISSYVASVDIGRTDAGYGLIFGQVVVALDSIETKLFHNDKIVRIFNVNVINPSIIGLNYGSSTARMVFQFNDISEIPLGMHFPAR